MAKLKKFGYTTFTRLINEATSHTDNEDNHIRECILYDIHHPLVIFHNIEVTFHSKSHAAYGFNIYLDCPLHQIDVYSRS